MATGDQADVTSRLWSVIPPSWFPSGAPNVTALLSGTASAASWLYGLIGFAKAQTRLATAVGPFLDLFAFDYLGRAIIRRSKEADDPWRARIKAEILRERVTRAGMSKAISDLTGNAPVIMEPWNPGDMGGLGICLALSGTGAAGAGGVGTLDAAQSLIQVAPPSLQAIPNVAGLGSYLSGLGSGQMEVISLADAGGAITVSEIYATVNNTKPVGASAWVQIENIAMLAP